MSSCLYITAILVSLLFGVVPKVYSNQLEESDVHQFEMWYDRPANNWNEALPIGNGRLGAMIYGGVEVEHIQFNEETLWTGEPRSYAHDGASDYLDEIQQLLFKGKQEKATNLAMDNFMSNPIRQKAYQPFGDLYLSFEGHKESTEYSRSLSLNNAIHSTKYKVGDINFKREILSSYPDQVIAIKISADSPDGLSFELWMDAVHIQKSIITKNNIQQLKISVKDGALFGEALLRIDTDGTLSEKNGKLKVDKSSYAEIYLTAATNYKRYNDISGDPNEINQNNFNKLGNKSFEKIKADHIVDYQSLFNRFTINLGENDKTKLPIDKRIVNFGDDSGDPQLIALYVQFGRYLMISSSREGTYPANLQGIWNESIFPAWDSKYTTNINAEMNYWLSEVANLSETHEPLFKMIEEVAESGTITAQKHYDSRGWILHHNTDIWRGTAPINHANHGIYLGGSGWMSHHLWEHYLFTGDKEFLKERAYPIMKQAALFYYDVLIEDPNTGWLVSSPSNSPETGGLVYGPTMDHQIIRSLYKACIEASAILDTDEDFALSLSEKLGKIAPDQIGQYGQLQEWVEDKDDTSSRHRHVSHLWGMHPGKEINWDESPELMEAAKKSLEFRGDDGTGWSLAWKINFWARFLDGNHAYELIKMLFRPVSTDKTNYGGGGGSYPNLFDAHPPFQIDGNFGASAGIIEMLIQSHLNRIHILPALPDALPEGYITGVKARGGYELSFSWEGGELKTLYITSSVEGPCTIQYLDKKIVFNTNEGSSYALNGELILLDN